MRENMKSDHSLIDQKPVPVRGDSLLWHDDEVLMARVSEFVEILPPKYFYLRASLNRESPQKAILCAVLEEALDCYQSQFAARSRAGRRHGSEAEAWLFSDQGDETFSFPSICAALNLDPEPIRRALKHRKPAHKNTRPARRLHLAEMPQRRVA
jgi:hypothetical protein